MKKYFLLILTGILVLTSCTTNKNQKIDKLLNEFKEKHNIVGFSVAVVKDNVLIFNNSYGYKNLTEEKLADKKTKYRIASISKLVTTLASMKLYEDNKFDLDADVSQYLGFKLRNPHFPNQVISIRKLLSHTSSLRDGDAYGEFLMNSYNSDNPPPIESLVNYYPESVWSIEYGPDDNYFEYGNINFGIVGTLIEILSGKRFDIFCKEILFDPMSLDCSFDPVALTNLSDLSILYRKKNNKWVSQTDDYSNSKPRFRSLENYKIGNNGLPYGPQGSLRASAADLSNIILLFLNDGKLNGKQIFKKETLDEMLKPVWIKNGNNGSGYDGMYNSYSLANTTTKNLIPGVNLTGHSGDAYGLISDMYFNKKEKFGIIFIANGGIWGKGKSSGWMLAEEEIYQLLYNHFIEADNE